MPVLVDAMDAPTFSPRRAPSAYSRRTPRSPLPPTSCVDVQWTFLSPQSVPNTASPARRSPQKVYDDPHARAAYEAEQAARRAAQDAADAHDQRVLYDLLGETQRQAMLDHTMREMEAMALVPVKRLASPRTQRSDRTPAPRRSSVLQVPPPPADERDGDTSARSDNSDSEDPENDDLEATDESRRAADDIPDLHAIRDRHRRRRSVDFPSRRVLDTDIRWQKTAHVGVALDLPVALVRDDDEDSDGQGELLEETPLADLFRLSEAPVHKRVSCRSTTLYPLPQQHASRTPVVQHPPLDFSTSPRAARVRKAPYGSWYSPRDEWWQLHETQQDALAEVFPHQQPPPVERHACERQSPNQRRYHREAATLTHPDAWPSLLRSPVQSPRVAPLVRSSPLPSPRPTAPRSYPSPRTSVYATSPFTPPPPTASGRSEAGRSLPSRASNGDRDVPLTPKTPHKKASTVVTAPDAIALRAAELQQEIPKVYIAREYRNYLEAKGARVPTYLTH